MNQNEHVSGIAGSPPVTVGDTEYTGAYLALMVATSPNTPGAEAARTPQLIAELGRIVAIAYRAKVDAETAYRIWRDTTIHTLTNSITAAVAAGFECASDPGVDSRGKEKPPKTPASSAAESYMRSLPEYGEHQATISEREEAWATVHAALDAAKNRTWAVRIVSDQSEGRNRSAGDDNRRRIEVSADFHGTNGIESNEAATRRPPPPPRRK